MITDIVARNVLDTLKIIREHSVVKGWYKFLDNFIIDHKKVLCLPCAQSKLPSYTFSKSPYYKQAYKLREELKNSFEIFTVSEPLAIHPSYWVWVSSNEYVPREGILPYYDVTGLFDVKKKDYQNYLTCIEILAQKIKDFVDRNKNTLFVFLVKPYKSHGDMLCKAFELDRYKDFQFSNVVILGEGINNLKGFNKAFYFVKGYEKELREVLK